MDNLMDLFHDQLKDIYDAEHQLMNALPRMESAASSDELRTAFRQHLDTTKQQASRLEDVFHKMGLEPQRKTCKGMQGLIAEGEEIIQEKDRSDPQTIDAALISAAQRVEHYEMAAYGTVRDFAEKLGKPELKDIIQRTLDEEGKTDHRLTEIAQKINPKAT